MANSPKDSPLSSADTCALYYFPEIPSCEQQNGAPATISATFVGGAVETINENGPDNSNPEDSEQVRVLIEEAFAKGMEQGRAETMTAQQERVKSAVGALQTAMKETEQVRRTDIQRMETETVRLALAIAKKIIGTAAEHGHTIAHVVNQAMQKVTDQRQLMLRLNPADMNTVDTFKQDLMMDGDAGTVIRLEGDETIRRGGCVIETRLGDIDARIEQQIKIVEQLLESQLPQMSTDE